MIIDQEFAGLIPPLTHEEYSGLEASILAEGCRDALVVWGEVLVDGHNRYRICEAHGVPYNVVHRDFTDRNEVLLWMLNNQLGRRNLNDFQRVEMVRKCEDAVKAQAEQRMLKGKADPMEKFPQGTSRDTLGAMAGVSGKTYEHAAVILDEAPEEVIQAARINELSINAAYEVTKLPQEQQQEVSRRISQGEKHKDVLAEVRKPHVSYNSGNNEWYTPSDYIDLAREVMGSIDLDPASSHKANEVVKAKRYYTAEDDGLSKDWYGNVWLNPPYSSELITKFTDKLLEELPIMSQALVLVNNATETEWFSRLVNKASAVCFPRSRVKFYMPDGTIGAPLQGQALLYFGIEPMRFVEVFRAKGWCALPQ